MIGFLLRVLSKILTIMVVLWGVGLYWFTTLIPVYSYELPDQVDGIVILTGGSGRLEMSLNLLSKVKVKKMLISGVGARVTINDIKSILAPDLALILEDNRSKIELGYFASSTNENALEAREWINNNNFNSIILVTSNYHMPRSVQEFSRSLAGIKVYPYSVFSGKFDAKKWYESINSTNLVISEYNKYLVSIFKK